MGKAARRQRREQASTKTVPAPFVARPFEGLPDEADWVALREIVPAATARARLRDDAPAGAGRDVTVVTVLPMAWPALHRDDGELLLALQHGGSASGDASRDAAAALLAAAAGEPGTPVADPGRAQFATPRLQDVLDLDVAFDPVVHEGFDFWVSGDLDEQGRASLERAQEAIVPTTKLDAAPAAYWCRVGERTHLRWILPGDEDAATAALARLHVAGELAGPGGLGDGTRFLGAFRACGLLAPVWDLDPALDADAYEEPLARLAPRLAEAVADTRPLDADERRAKAGILSRQLTLR